MKLIPNIGNDRVIDELCDCLTAQSTLDIATPAFSLFAFAECQHLLRAIESSRIVIPTSATDGLQILGGDADRSFRNQLNTHWLAKKCAEWIGNKVSLREVQGSLPQCLLVASHSQPEKRRVVTGNCPFTTDGLGITSGNQFSLVQSSEREPSVPIMVRQH